MIYNGDLVKINGEIIPHIKQYKIGRSKLWKDADRNMNGDVRASLIRNISKDKNKSWVSYSK